MSKSKEAPDQDPDERLDDSSEVETRRKGWFHASIPSELRVPKAEPHVQQAAHVAWVVAGKSEVGASDLVRAILTIEPKVGSAAFRYFASLLELKDLPNWDVSNASDARLPPLRLSAELLQAFRVASPHLEGKTVWGRDLITLILLSKDRSLIGLAHDGGTSLEELRDQWFRFVTSTGAADHRSREEWTRWWQDAQVTPPTSEESTQHASDQDAATSTSGADVNETRQAETYILTWNPKQRPFSEFEDVANEVNESGSAVSKWSTGIRLHMAPGDQVILIRQAKEPTGLVGLGTVLDEPFEDLHHRETMAEKGQKTHFTRVRWTLLREVPLLSLDELRAITGDEQLWTDTNPGTQIPRPAARRLLRAIMGRSQPPRAGFDADAISPLGERFRPSESDQLDVKTQADIFSSLILAEDVRLPFAICLLGDWGVGKTFFMRLMQETVETVAGPQATGAIPNSVSRVVQIEFNAWHYVDSDLWASLANHIFDHLADELDVPDDEEESDPRIRLRQRIDSSRREQREARAAISAAETSREEAAGDLKTKEEEIAQARTRWRKKHLARVWSALVEANRDSDTQDLGEMKDRAEAVAHRLGIADAIDNVEDLERVRREMKRVVHRGAGLTAALSAAFHDRRQALRSLSLLGALVAILILVGYYVTERFDGSELASLLTFWTQAMALTGAVLAWASHHLRSASKALGFVETLSAKLREPDVDLGEPGEEEALLRAEVDRLEAEIAVQERKVEEADRQISKAEAEIQRINSGGLVYDFVSGRRDDSQYADRLGLISTIRRDFQELGALLRDWRKSDATDRESPSAQQDAANDSAPPPIERIVLYIDDLDRCPPKLVVEVLQAVHLLLAFDLFVVVVAVDARWLERSLQESYDPWLMQSGSPQQALHRFNADNYLEKIFQIAYSVPAMTEEGYRNLVTDLLPTHEDLRRDPTGENGSKESDDGAAARAGKAPSGNDDEALESDDPDPAPTPASGESGQGVTSNDPAMESGFLPSAPNENFEAQLRAEAMVLTREEQVLIRAVAHFIDTPRLAKRLVNVYKLLRVRAWHLTRDDSFTQPLDGEYRAAMILLALSVGEADAPELLDAIRNSSDPVPAYEPSFSDWLKRRLKVWKEDASTSPNRHDHLDRLVRTAGQLQRGMDVARRYLESASAGDSAVKSPTLDDRLPIYRKWAHEVGRFSFRWHVRSIESPSAADATHAPA